MANCEWQKTNENLYRCKHCRLISDTNNERYCLFASKPHMSHGKPVDTDIKYLENNGKDSEDNYIFQCKNCGFSYLDKEAEIVLHSCKDYLASINCEDMSYTSKTKSGKFVFSCEKCGFKHKNNKLKTIRHCCEDYKCQWEPLGEEFKCRFCGIVLKEKESILCPSKTGLNGFGDLVAKGLKKLGINQKEGCGCGDKQKKLNEMIPFK